MFPRLLSAVRWPLIAIGLTTAVASACAEPRVGWSFDVGTDAAKAAAVLGELQAGRPVASGSWLRIRGLAVPTGADAAAELQRTRAALQDLRENGYRLIAHLRWSTDSWPGGTRQPAVNRLPVDLRAPFERCRALAATYGDLVDYWEIDNEPDISFVQENPETYAAYLKACYAGIARGNVERRSKNWKGGKPEEWKTAAAGAPAGTPVSSFPTSQISTFPARAASRVLMAPLALPPGPYFEAFVANGGLSYTDGFNYHFYGYAEDFSGVYHQFEAAITRLTGATARRNAETLTTDTLPSNPGSQTSPTEHPPSPSLRRAGTDHTEEPTKHAKHTKKDQARVAAGDPNSACQRVSVSAFAPSVFHTQFFSNAAGWRATVLERFDEPAAQGEANRQLLLNRPLAHEEPVLHRQGRWLVSDGVTVEEHGDVWRFTVTHWPAGPYRAPEAELALGKANADTLTTDKLKSISGSQKSPTDEERRKHTKYSKYPPTGSQEGAEEAEKGDKIDQRPRTKDKRSEPISAFQRVSVSAFPSDSLLTFEYRSVEVPGVKTVKAEDALSAGQQHADPNRTGFNPIILQKETKVTKGQSGSQEEAEAAEKAARDQRRETRDQGPATNLEPQRTEPTRTEASRTEHVSAFRVSPSTLDRSSVSSATSCATVRELPVFLTEYGYGSLDKVTRDTADGRERQRAFFAQVDQQIRDLGIDGAMAFVLMPYLENNSQEFGLLSSDPVPSAQGEEPEIGNRHGRPETGNLKPESSPLQVSGLKAQVSTSASQRGEYFVSPALSEILRHGNTPVTPKRWTVATPPPSPVVIDFIGGYGLGQSKSYCGYFLEREAGLTLPGHGNLVVYNFSDKEITGELTLTGDAWTFPARDIKPETRNLKPESSPTQVSGLKSQVSSSLFLRLKPGARLLVPVRVWTQVDHFVACPAGAEFREAAIPVGIEPFEPEVTKATGQPGAQGPKPKVQQPISASEFPLFAPYVRTANGNLYGTWPRLPVAGTWKRYMHRAEDFTMFFWGRANRPWRLEENRPVALVFGFYPNHFPAVYEFRAAQVETFEKANAETLKH